MLDEERSSAVLSFRRSKSRCIEKLLTLSREFSEASSRDGESGGLETLEFFETRRDAIIKAMQLFDRKITEALIALPGSARTTELIQSLREIEKRDQELVGQLLELDQRIIQRIELEQGRIQRELGSTRKNRDTIGRFKSTWMNPSGEEFDVKL